MRYFISYKFTGVPLDVLHKEIDPIVAVLREKGHDVFCNLYSESMYQSEKYNGKMIMKHCFEELERSDVYLTYITDQFGGGQAIECGYACKLGLQIVACAPEGMEQLTSLKAVSDLVIRYSSHSDLLDRIKKI
jgi:nucleoside 2-deoxyribosyltransferase